MKIESSLGLEHKKKGMDRIDENHTQSLIQSGPFNCCQVLLYYIEMETFLILYDWLPLNHKNTSHEFFNWTYPIMTKMLTCEFIELIKFKVVFHHWSNYTIFFSNIFVKACQKDRCCIAVYFSFFSA